MQFISTFREPQYVLKHTRRSVVQTTDAGAVTVVDPGIRVAFRPLSEPFRTPLLATRQGAGEAWGILDTEIAAREAKVPENIIVEALMGHPHYGVHIIGIGADGDLVSGEDRYYSEDAETGEVYCRLCDKALKNTQAKNGHSRSIAHGEKLREAEVKARKALGAA